MRTGLELMTVFVGLIDNEFRAAPIEMWSETFTSWAAVHGRTDDESAEQVAEYEKFLRASIWHLKERRDAPRPDLAGERTGNHAESVLTGIFSHVARLIAFAEHKVAGGKMPRGKESAVLGRETLLRLLDNDVALLDEAVQHEREKHPTG
jgi:hypothetical protein